MNWFSPIIKIACFWLWTDSRSRATRSWRASFSIVCSWLLARLLQQTALLKPHFLLNQKKKKLTGSWGWWDPRSRCRRPPSGCCPAGRWNTRNRSNEKTSFLRESEGCFRLGRSMRHRQSHGERDLLRWSEAKARIRPNALQPLGMRRPSTNWPKQALPNLSLAHQTPKPTKRNSPRRKPFAFPCYKEKRTEALFAKTLKSTSQRIQLSH